MDIFAELRNVATRQSAEGDFPLWLMAEVIAIAGAPKRYAGKLHQVELLVTQISNFDLYAGTGCFDSSVGIETIQSTIRQLSA